MTRNFTKLADVVEFQPEHPGLHNEERNRMDLLDNLKMRAEDVWALLPEWRIDYNVSASSWPARNVPAGFTSTYPNKRVVWASPTAAAGTPPGIVNGDYLEYYE